MIARGQKGFTMVELLISLAIIGIMSMVITRLYMMGVTSWRYTQVKLQVSTEAKLIMAAMTKFIQSANGSSITISRLDTNQPANSYISGVLAETIYITDSQTKCCGSGGSEYITVGVESPPVEVYQNNNLLIFRRPVPIPGADITDPNVAHYTYKSMTLTTNLDSISFAYDNSMKSDAIVVNAKFSKLQDGGKPPHVAFLKKTIIIKHMHSAGYYGN